MLTSWVRGDEVARVRVVRAVWRELSTRSRRLPACRGAIPSLSQQPPSALVIIVRRVDSAKSSNAFGHLRLFLAEGAN